MRIAPFIACALAAAAAPANADWQRASSPHFIIYADESPDKLKAFAEKLERFDKAVRVTRSMEDPPVGDGNRLTIFIVPGVFDVQQLMRGAGGNAAGLLFKGNAVVGRAKAGDKAATFANARSWLNRANRLDPENPEALVLFYLSFVEERASPTPTPLPRLITPPIWHPTTCHCDWKVPAAILGDGKPLLARARLFPLAYNPHGGPLAAQAQQLIGLIDSGKASATAAP